MFEKFDKKDSEFDEVISKIKSEVKNLEEIVDIIIPRFICMSEDQLKKYICLSSESLDFFERFLISLDLKKIYSHFTKEVKNPEKVVDDAVLDYVSGMYDFFSEIFARSEGYDEILKSANDQLRSVLEFPGLSEQAKKDLKEFSEEQEKESVVFLKYLNDRKKSVLNFEKENKYYKELKINEFSDKKITVELEKMDDSVKKFKDLVLYVLPEIIKLDENEVEKLYLAGEYIINFFSYLDNIGNLVYIQSNFYRFFNAMNIFGDESGILETAENYVSSIDREYFWVSAEVENSPKIINALDNALKIMIENPKIPDLAKEKIKKYQQEDKGLKYFSKEFISRFFREES